MADAGVGPRPDTVEALAVQVQAAAILLDRGWGKPTQPIGGDPDSPIIVEIMGRRDGRQLYRSL